MIETDQHPSAGDGPQWVPGPPGRPTGSAEPEAAYAIEIEGMRKSYGRTPAVRNLSMHVPRGSVYGFVGPNGAGKTTTIRTLATLQRPDAGTVKVDGIDVTRDPGAVRDRVGYMPDFFGVYESLTVGEYLDFYGASHHIPAARRRQLSDELLELVDLADKRKEPVEWLSRGMKQRLGLARCLVHDPRVLLLDEPASGMDPRARIELREILRELSKMDKTILISSHILPELGEMCTHVGIIRSGELLAEGPVDAIVSTLSSSTRLCVRLLDGRHREAAARLLEAHPACHAVEADGLRPQWAPRGYPEPPVRPTVGPPEGGHDESCSLVAEFTGSDEDLASLLAQLVAAGVRVTRFAREGGSLEDIFLHVTEMGEDEA